MSKKINAALDRRAAIRVGAVGAVATAATVAAASSAQAAAGQPVIQGAVNTVGTAGTTLQSSGTAVSLTVKNTGPGAGAFFFAQNNNGFAGGTAAANKYGLSAANTGTAGFGAAVAASGNENSGVLANSNNSDRYALEAINFTLSGNGEGGGLYAEGGETPGVVAISNIGVPAALSIGDTIYIEGHEIVFTLNSVVYGVTSEDGPEVTFSRSVELDGEGSATVDLVSATTDDVDLSGGVPLVSANSGPMPNLWITLEGTEVQIAGGTPGGTVSFRVVGYRTDWGSAPTAKSGRRAPAGVDVAKRAAKAAKARSNRS